MDRRGKTLFLLIATAFWLLSLAACTSQAAPTGQAPSVLAPFQGATAALPAAAGTPTPMRVSGQVLSGGDTTPGGLQDAPRRFAYEVQTDSGEKVTVQYTAFPPSPARNRQAILLDFHAGQIQVGDYLVASGTYDPSTHTLVVQEKGDSIHTYSKKP